MGIKVLVAGVLLAVTIGGYVLALTVLQRNARHKTGLSRFLFILATIFLILLIVVPGSIFSISTGEVGVVKVFGEAKHTVSPGIHFQFWLSNTVERYDIKTREINLVFEAYSKDAQTITGILAIQYQIMPDKLIEINSQYGSVNALEERLKAIIIERAKSVFSDKGAMVIVEGRSSLSGEIEQRIAPMMEPYYVTVTAVALEDISFNDAFESAVEQKMVAEQEKLRAEYDKEKAIIKAEEALAVAEREAKAVIEKAQGDAEALLIMQEAWSSLTPEVKEAMLTEMFYAKWNGVLPEVMSGDSIDLILNGLTSGSRTTSAAPTE
ncbi:MAG: prohibitin family protein [Oscillospiraceae bacterium]|nr:prohibitin family protein [Oscillospiraceae bacterium]